MRRILCLYLPHWPIQRLRGEREVQNSEFGMQNAAIILHARDPRRGELVVACNRAAQERGVQPEMPLAEAATLAKHGSSHAGAQTKVCIQPHDPAADLAALARLAEHCERYSPLVGWETVEGVQRSEVRGQRSASWSFPGPDCLFLDVTGIGVLFGGEETLARAVVADLARLGYEARVVIAGTIGAAWAGARQGESGIGSQESRDRGQETGDREGENYESGRELSTQYLVLGTEYSIPDSRLPTPDPLPLFRTPQSALRTLPVDSLRLPPETTDLLAQLGLERIEQLLALPRESLRARFGERLLLRIDQLLGTAQETIVPYRPPPQFIEEWIFDFPAERRDVIEQVVQELVRRVAQALADRREGAVQLSCRLDCAGGRPLILQVGLFCPSADTEHLWDLVWMQLEQHSFSGPIGRVTVAAILTALLENRQGELFAGGELEISRQLALFMDRCSSRLGAKAVLRPILTADPLPERAVRYRPGVGSRESGVRRGRTEVGGRRSEVGRKVRDALHRSALRAPSSALERPLALHSPPLALEVVSIAPDGPPVRFSLHGQVHQVVHRWGPERIEAGWWRGASVRRDYWRIETESGQRFWLFRRLTDGKWRLQGEYQ